MANELNDLFTRNIIVTSLTLCDATITSFDYTKPAVTKPD